MKEEIYRILWTLISKHFPGVTAETLKRGWIPIPAVYLENQLRRGVGSKVDGLETISLRCCPGHFRTEITTSKYLDLVKNRISATIENSLFALNRSERVAVFRCAEAVELRGINLLGKVVAYLAGSLVLGAIQSTDTATKVLDVSRGACELKWPEITIRLDKIREVHAVIEKRVPLPKWLIEKGLRLPNALGEMTILDMLSFGPMRVEEKHVQIKVGRSEGAVGRLLHRLLG